MIINSGARTDIPAFYSDWFINRIKEGYVLVRNPYRQDWITRYELNTNVVDALAFCTKNPAPMLDKIQYIKDFGQYWFVTVTPYGRDIEPNVPPKEEVMESFKQLSKIVGINCVGWRYDPVFISEEYSVERHISDFEKMAAKMSGYTHTCVISFIDLYDKVRKNFPEAHTVSKQQRHEIGRAFAEIGRKYGIVIKGCAEGTELAEYGVDCGGCMTKETFELAVGERLIIPNVKSSRPACNCILGTDIGSYDTCGHLCRYCYANTNKENVIKNIKLHDKYSPLLIGNVKDGEEIHPAKQESYIDRQLSLF